MKTFKKSVLAIFAVAVAAVFTACSDANEYGDSNTTNPTWGSEHPASISGSVWNRTAGLKTNAYGQDVMGYVASVDFYREDSCIVAMSDKDANGNKINTDAQGKDLFSTAVWVDDSNSESLPRYSYEYNETSGALSIFKVTYDSKNKATKTVVFTGVVAESNGKAVMTISHTSDTPSQTYLVKK